MNIQQKIWLPIVIAGSAVVLFGSIYKTFKPNYISTRSLNHTQIEKILSENPNLIEALYNDKPIIVDKNEWEKKEKKRLEQRANSRRKANQESARIRDIYQASEEWKEISDAKERGARQLLKEWEEEEEKIWLKQGLSNNTGKGSKRKKHKKHKKTKKHRKYKK